MIFVVQFNLYLNWFSVTDNLNKKKNSNKHLGISFSHTHTHFQILFKWLWVFSVPNIIQTGFNIPSAKHLFVGLLIFIWLTGENNNTGNNLCVSSDIIVLQVVPYLPEGDVTVSVWVGCQVTPIRSERHGCDWTLVSMDVLKPTEKASVIQKNHSLTFLEQRELLSASAGLAVTIRALEMDASSSTHLQKDLLQSSTRQVLISPVYGSKWVTWIHNVD